MKKLIQLTSVTINIILLSMVVEYFRKGNLMSYNYVKYLIIGAVLGVVTVLYKSFRSKQEIGK